MPGRRHPDVADSEILLKIQTEHHAAGRPLMDMVRSRVAIIRSVSRAGRAIDEPNPPVIYQATGSNFDFRSAEPIDRIASGKGETDADAMHSAIGEALERYCASLYD